MFVYLPDVGYFDIVLPECQRYHIYKVETKKNGAYVTRIIGANSVDDLNFKMYGITNYIKKNYWKAAMDYFNDKTAEVYIRSVFEGIRKGWKDNHGDTVSFFVVSHPFPINVVPPTKYNVENITERIFQGQLPPYIATVPSLYSCPTNV
jgi:hypothetical protein